MHPRVESSESRLNDGQFVISAAVMTHPSREASARRVLSQLSEVDAKLAVDPDPDGPPSAVRSAQLAFSATADSATHHLVVQDDITVPAGYHDALLQAVAAHPEAAISLFVEWGSRTANLARWAAFAGRSFVPVINPYMPTVALVVPAALAKELAQHLALATDSDEPDDRAILRFLQSKGTPSLVVVPNLVEHLDLPSLTGNDDHGMRRATSLWSAGAPAVGPDVLEVPRYLPFVAWTTGAAFVIDTHNDVISAHRPAVDVLTEWGVGEAQLGEAFQSALKSAPGLPSRVEERLLFEVWVTAVAMGAVQQAVWPQSVAGLRGTLDPAVAQSLYTFLPGALRRYVDVDSFVEIADELVAWTLAAVLFGAAECRPDMRLFRSQ
jgi:hypothetical protein